MLSVVVELQWSFEVTEYCRQALELLSFLLFVVAELVDVAAAAAVLFAAVVEAVLLLELVTWVMLSVGTMLSMILRFYQQGECKLERE